MIKHFNGEKQLLGKIVDCIKLYIEDPHKFWGIKDTPTLEKQIKNGDARTDEELDQVVKCPLCDQVIS